MKNLTDTLSYEVTPNDLPGGGDLRIYSHGRALTYNDVRIAWLDSGLLIDVRSNNDLEAHWDNQSYGQKIDEINFFIAPVMLWVGSVVETKTVGYFFGFTDESPEEALANHQEASYFKTMEDAKAAGENVLVEVNEMNPGSMDGIKVIVYRLNQTITAVG